MSDSSSVPMRTSVAALTSDVQRYCRTATMVSKTTIPDRTSGQNGNDRLSRSSRMCGVERLDGRFVKRRKPRTPTSKPGSHWIPTHGYPVCPLLSCKLGELLPNLGEQATYAADWRYCHMLQLSCQGGGTIVDFIHTAEQGKAVCDGCGRSVTRSFGAA